MNMGPRSDHRGLVQYSHSLIVDQRSVIPIVQWYRGDNSKSIPTHRKLPAWTIQFESEQKQTQNHPHREDITKTPAPRRIPYVKI